MIGGLQACNDRWQFGIWIELLDLYMDVLFDTLQELEGILTPLEEDWISFNKTTKQVLSKGV